MASRLLFLLALLFAGCATAATIVVSAGGDSMDLGDAFDYRADASGQSDIADVAAAPGAFRALGRRELNRGPSRDVHWLRTTFVNVADVPLTRWLEVGHTRLQSVRLFWREGSAWRESAAGTEVPRSRKLVVAATPVLPLTLAPHEVRTVYIRVASETQVNLHATLWEPLAFRNEETAYFMGQSALLSAILLVAGFSLLIWLLLRDLGYLLFAWALLFQAGLEASISGTMQRYLWPATMPFATGFIVFCSALALFFHALFLRYALDLQKTLPFWNRVIVALAGLALVSILGAMFHNYELSFQVLMLDGMALATLAPMLSLARLRRGYRPARFLFAGFAVLWIAAFVYLTMLAGLLPTSALVISSVPLATVLASMLFFLAIAERTRELHVALDCADAANVAKSTFLAHISHDLRTPLNTVIGFARLLHKGAPHVTPQEGGRAIERSGLHLLSMIDELLDLARGDLGRLRLSPAPTAWKEFIDAIAETARVMVQSKANCFLLDVEGALPSVVMIDSRRLRQVLENLIANANRHTHVGEVTLVCRAERTDKIGNVRLRFRVIDTGEGVAPEDVESIFEPFQRGARQATERGAEGVGLGLPIARQLVALMGGELRLEETSPRGSTFGFVIECASLASVEVISLVNADSWPEDAGKGRTVLVAEDAVDSRILLVGILKAMGFGVIEAASGHEALAQLDAKVDLVLTDQFMPDGDGWDVLCGARERGLRMPVVLVSAAEARRPDDFPSGTDFDAKINKPLDSAQLCGVLGILLSIELKKAQAGDAVLKPEGSENNALIIPPSVRRKELARLVNEGRVTDIADWAQALAAEAPEWQGYAIRVKEAARRLDFADLGSLASGE